ncbi:ATP-binding cassette domain-containing protein [Qipengyuania sp. 6B39]|uniref:ABC transporter ATP-binding protein n=1 Tax=Qipengyuania proteolytica TaxID=2867239 RepID=UPI001C8A048F|nr:ATP-binding cassette domain-containing protein [Qipengyuania proteolytica]MBX7494589.1 ATP-binding cassette domain-containing protein [Qipengyuania proteolytica]
MAVLRVENLTKRFGDVVAVDDLSFAVQPGEIFGFLGGNGAGKTTTLRMVLDIIRPTSGTIEVLGAAPNKRKADAIGFLPEERGLYAHMKAIDTIVYFGRLKDMSPADARQHGMELLARFDLADRAKAEIGDMSKGMAQKVQLACALVNRPELLMLDEPFSGLDPVNQGLLEDEILRASQRGAAVIFSTHVMQHAERLCDRLLLLKKGAKRFEGTLDEARATLPARIAAVAKADIASVRGVATATPVEELGDGWHAYEIELAPGVPASAVLEGCSTQGVALRRFEEQRPSLHEVFVQLVGSEGVEQ